MAILFRAGGFAALCGVLLGLAAPARASNDPAMDAQVARIGNEWARIKYRVPDKSQQYRQLDALAKQAAAVVAHFPGRAEPLLWQGIVTSEEAAVASMFSQLGLATSARDILQKAATIDPKAGNGGVSMSLGVLYYKVPGFPIGFGSAKKAREYLRTALAVDPGGLDANYFYGDYLIAQGDYVHAKSYLVKALQAPADPTRPVWDSGRRADIRALIAKVDKQQRS